MSEEPIIEIPQRVIDSMNAFGDALAASECAPVIIEGPAKVVTAEATGSLPVSSAEALCLEWKKRSKDHRAHARANGETYGGPDLRHTFAADVYLVCESMLRIEMARANLRQPEGNDQALPRGGAQKGNDHAQD